MEENQLITETKESQAQPIQENGRPIKSKFSFPVISVLLVAVVLLTVGGLAYAAGAQQWLQHILPNLSTNPGTMTPSPEISNSFTSLAPITEPLFSGTLTQLDQDLQLFIPQPDFPDSSQGKATYYSAGTFMKGSLAGYTRIIALKPPMGPTLPDIYILATKDFQSYILDDPNKLTEVFADTNYQNPFSRLDKNKIASIATFDTELPQVANLDQQNSMFADHLVSTSTQSGQFDANGNPVFTERLVTDNSDLLPLDSPFPQMSLWFRPYQSGIPDINALESQQKTQEQTRQTYFDTMTEVIALDSTGLPMSYDMTVSENIATYQQQKQAYDQAMLVYEAERQKYENKEITDYPSYPTFVFPPSMGFDGSEVLVQPDTTIFQTYQTAIPNACASTLNTRIFKSLTDQDVIQIGTVFNRPLYSLKNAQHPLNQLQYAYKFDYYTQFPDEWSVINPGTNLPNYDDYVAEHPLLLMKDYWGRWVGLGEFDIKLPGGCGKPVIYLYPEETEQVSVRLLVPTQFTTSIPVYDSGWNVLAQPSGQLHNLQPEKTDCQTLDTAAFGSAYVAQACDQNAYPYLYWSGNVMGKEYPTMNEGWYVARTELRPFLVDSLTKMGFKMKEREDFLEYWLPTLQQHQTPYFRISFLQTDEVNNLFPLAVSPQPQTLLRMFMDYEPLASLPNNPLPPQDLRQVNRQGFSLVEWGGLKR